MDQNFDEEETQHGEDVDPGKSARRADEASQHHQEGLGQLLVYRLLLKAAPHELTLGKGNANGRIRVNVITPLGPPKKKQKPVIKRIQNDTAMPELQQRRT